MDLVEKAGLKKELATAENLTVFVPSNEAIQVRNGNVLNNNNNKKKDSDETSPWFQATSTTLVEMIWFEVACTVDPFYTAFVPKHFEVKLNLLLYITHI